MKDLTVGEFKRNFSDVLDRVQKGQKIIISYGRKRKRVAVLVPYGDHIPAEKRKLGMLENTGSCVFHDDFKMTEEELLSS